MDFLCKKFELEIEIKSAIIIHYNRIEKISNINRYLSIKLFYNVII